MEYRKYAFFSLSCLVLAMLLCLAQVQKNREAFAARLAPSILRFHVLADSDDADDQAVKLEVRSLILDYLSDRLAPDAGKEETAAYLQNHQKDVEQAANAYLAEKGFSYTASLELTNCYFPTRVYDDLVFPCGSYDAARIVLGKGEGHNWWCVLYPRLCFVDTACEVPAETDQTLKSTLEKDDYLALQDNRPDLQIRFRILPFFNPQAPQSPSRPTHNPQWPTEAPCPPSQRPTLSDNS